MAANVLALNLLTGRPTVTSGQFLQTTDNINWSKIVSTPTTATGYGIVLVASDIPSLDASKITTGILLSERGGTGVSNYTGSTLTFSGGVNIVGSGTFRLGGFDLTVPGNGTVDLLEKAQTITKAKTFTITGNTGGTVEIPIIVGHDETGTGGTPADGIGVGIRFQAETSTSTGQLIAEIDGIWANVTHASRSAALKFSLFSVPASAFVERVRITASGALWIGKQASGLTGVGDLDASGIINSNSHITAGTYIQSAAYITSLDQGIFTQGATGGLNFADRGATGADWLLYGSTSIGRLYAQSAALDIAQFTPTGYFTHIITDALTNTSALSLDLVHTTTGTPAAGLGNDLTFYNTSSTGASRITSAIRSEWADPTNSVRNADLVFRLSSAGTISERMRLTSSGYLGVGIAPTQALHVLGAGRFTTGLTLDNMTAGSILFAGTAGLISQDNTNLFWDDSNNRLGIGLTVPSGFQHIKFTGGTKIGLEIEVTSPSSDQLIKLIDPTNGIGSGSYFIRAIKGTTDSFYARGDGVGYFASDFTTDGNLQGNGTGRFSATDAVTNTQTSVFTLDHFSTGTPAANFGINFFFNLHSSTNTNRNAALFQVLWSTATDASRKAELRMFAYDTSAREVLRIGTSASAAAIGFFAGGVAVQQASGADLTNNITSGGVNDTITNWTNLSTYSTDAAAIRNAVYQLARKLKQINDGLRAYNMFT